MLLRSLLPRGPRMLAAALLLSGLYAAPVCLAQTNSGTLFGRVQDRAGRRLEGVTVQVVNEQSGNPRSGVTDAEGNFVIARLRAGTYRISASKEGFFPQSYERFPVQITVKNEVRVPDIMLRQASVNGSVTDRAGNPLGGAKVVAAAVGSRARRSALTDRLGRFRLEDLPPGPYIITAAWAEGASRGLTSEPLALEREETTAPSLRLLGVLRGGPNQAGAAAPAPAAEGARASSLVHTVDVARVSNFSGRLFESAPVGGATPMRSFDEFALLAPGVSPPPYTPGARGPGVGFGVGTAGQYSVNGMRARSNNFSVDGSDNNDPDVGVRRQGFVALVPQPIETVKDFAVATLLWDAELGRNFGAQVNAVSDYGGNAFHGQLYAFLADSRTAARDFFDTAFGGRDPFTRAQYGFAFGGPVRRDRTHFFSSYGRQQASASVEQHFATPTTPERSFRGGRIFGAGLRGSTEYFGPFTGTTPLGRNVLSLYPAPNNPAGPYGANNFTETLPAGGAGEILSFHLAHEPWGASLFSGRYNFTDDRRTLPSVNRAIRSAVDAATRSHNLSLVFDSPLGPALFNQARFSFGRTALDFFERPGNPYVFSASSVESVPVIWARPPVVRSSQTGPIGELIVEPFSPVGVGVHTFPQRRASNTFQYADTVSWSAAAHAVKFGGNVRRYQLNSRLDRLYRPQVVYGGGFFNSPEFTDESFISGVELASLGVASSVLQTITSGPPDSTVGLRFTEYHAFVNDNWRAHPRFTLDFGLRYEYYTVPAEANGRIERALRLDGLPAAGGSRFDTPARTARFDAAVGAYREVLAGRASIYDPDRNNFGPRAGFAWSLDAEGQTVLRAGYGVYFDTVLGAVVSQSRNVFPNEIPVNVDPSFLSFDVFNLNNPVFLALDRDAAGNPTAPVRLLAAGACNQFGTCNQLGGAPEDYAALVGQLFLQNRHGGLAFTLPEKNLRTPYAQQWHLTFERELFGDYLLSVAYVGTKGTKLARLTTPNFGPLVTPLISSVSTFVSKPPGDPTPVPDGPFPIIVSDDVRGGFVFLDEGFDSACFLFITLGEPPPPLPGCAVGRFEGGPGRDRALGAFQIIESSAASSYHALQVEGRKRYAGGFQFTAAYTYSHAIDDVSDLFPVAGAPVLAENSRDLRRERASAAFDLRHRFASAFVWDIPFGRGAGGAAARLLGGWQLASIFQAQTGQPFTLNLPFDANLDGNLSDRPSTTDGLVFFGGHGPRRVALAPGRRPTDFATVSRVRLGGGETLFVYQPRSVGRNTARGDSFVNLDLALSKRLAFTEGQTLVLRAEVFNALNRAHFGLPVRVIGAPGFGSAVETAAPARTLQFAVKYAF
ncbi:MAG TPA: carboxypeptidase-like regulatory domain-containing protein [Pyrinomonadaceae bacterium]|nr:carboxypeptidase-like regulatory domain-containing protein [Pyrinomonadaceae bacterium]